MLKQIWTIVRHAILQAMRLKLALALIAFLFLLVPVLLFGLKADNTHAGQVRMVITYSLYAISLLLSILTIFLSAITLNTEIKQQQIFLLDVKPISRLTLLIGEWVGIMIINLVLLLVMLGVTYGCVMVLSRQQRGEPNGAYLQFQAEVLSARRMVGPPLPNLGKEIDEEYAKLKENNMLPEGKSEVYVKRQIAERFGKGAWVVPANSQMKWTISGLPKNQKDGWLILRYRHSGMNAASSSPVSVEYQIPGKFEINAGAAEKICTPEDYPPSMVDRTLSLVIPARAAGATGSIEVTYTNMDQSNVSALFPAGGGIAVLYPATSITWNFVRAGLVMLMKLTFYAIIGLAFSTFLSFPVAVTATLVVFLVGQMATFIQTDLLSGLFVFGSSMVPPWQELHPLDLALRRILSFLFGLFPNLNAYDVTANLGEGSIIEWRVIVHMLIFVILIRGGIAALAGWLIFRRRELAALTANT